MIVIATGVRTEVGKIGTLIEATGDRETPLEYTLSELGRALVGIVLVLCVIVVLTGWLRGNGLLYMVEVGISLAVIGGLDRARRSLRRLLRTERALTAPGGGERPASRTAAT